MSKVQIFMRIIEEFPDYSIDVYGNVYAIKLGRFLHPYSNGLGYIAVKIRKDGKRSQKYVHRLVATTYMGADNRDVNHIDGDKSNNFIDNLEYTTKSENLKHAFDNKLLKGFVTKFY